MASRSRRAGGIVISAPAVKICPLCGHANLAIASFCSKCDADLMNVPLSTLPVADTEAPIRAAELDSNASGASTERSAPPVIEGIGNDVATMRIDAVEGAIVLELVANPAVSFRVRPGQSVGRSSKADVVLAGVPELDYISRAHARFSKRRTQWYVQYIAEGNSITVDGTESRDDAEVAIYEGSIVVLSFTAFRVRVT